jgi:hypothetical protein
LIAFSVLVCLVAATGHGQEFHRPATLPTPRVIGAAPWPVGQAVPISVAGGRTRFDVPTPEIASKTLVIVSAMAKGTGPFPIRMSARPANRVSPPPLADDGPRRAVENVPAPADVPPVQNVILPPPERVFYMMVRDGDVASASNYLAVPGKLRAVGSRVQVYVDARDVPRVGEPLLRDLVTTFDDQVYPTAARHLGLARDVDGDGRFTVLISSWLAHLGAGRLAVDGFVRGADLDPDLGSPFGNRCDMMYLNSRLTPGPHLRTVLAHEYTHAVTASQKSFGGPEGSRWGPEEEGWLDEALAHLAEDLHGFSRSNLDYRVSAFLSNPERYRLVVQDYYASDLFRSHGNRGSTYLFLRWCADRFGPGLLGTLVRSPRRGIDNLEAATGFRFPALYRQWTVALALSGLGADLNHANGYRTVELRGEIDGWPLAGPRTSVVLPDGTADAWSLTGTSSHFVLVEAARTGAVHLEIEGPDEADLQVTVVPLPAAMARLELTVQPVPSADGTLSARVRIRERDGSAVRLSTLAWEPLVPSPDSLKPALRHGGLERLGIASTFGTTSLPAGGQLLSGPIALSGMHSQDLPLIIKAVGTDSRGHRVSAWAEIPGTAPAHPNGAAAAEARLEP